MMRGLFPLAMAGLLLAGAAHAVAEREIFPIELQEDSRLEGGKSAFLQGQTNAYGQQFSVAGTQLQQPIAVGVYTADPSRPLKLRVTKGSFDEPIRELETDAQGRIDLKFRTYDGFKLWVSAEQPSDYQLVVWVGNEIALHPPAAVIPETEYAASLGANGSAAKTGGLLGGTGLSRLELGMGFALVVLVLVIGFFLLLRRKTVRGTP